VFNSSDKLTDTLGKGSVGSTLLGEDRRVSPSRNLLDDGMHEVQDRFGRVGITGLDNGAVLVEAAVASDLLTLRVVVHVGDGDTKLIVVITTVEGRDGEVGTLSSVDFVVGNTIEGTADTRLLGGGTRFAVVVAACDGHRDTNVVSTRLVGDFNGLDDAVVADGIGVSALDEVEVLAHAFGKVTEGLDVLGREEVLGNVGSGVGTDTDTGRARGLVNVDDDGLEALEVVLGSGEEARGGGVGGSG